MPLEYTKYKKRKSNNLSSDNAAAYTSEDEDCRHPPLAPILVTEEPYAAKNVSDSEHAKEDDGAHECFNKVGGTRSVYGKFAQFGCPFVHKASSVRGASRETDERNGFPFSIEKIRRCPITQAASSPIHEKRDGGEQGCSLNDFTNVASMSKEESTEINLSCEAAEEENDEFSPTGHGKNSSGSVLVSPTSVKNESQGTGASFSSCVVDTLREPGRLAQKDTESEESLRTKAIINSALDPIVQINSRGVMQMVNTACCRVFQYREDELVGQNVKMLTPLSHASKHDEYIQNYLRTGIKKVMGRGRQLRGRMKDGRTFPMFLSLSEAQIGDEIIFTGIIRDLSAEERMRLKMEAIINSAVDPIVQINERGVIQMVNPACCHVFKYEEYQMVGKNVKMLMPACHGMKHDNYLANYVETGEKKLVGTSRKLRARKSDGSSFPIFLSVSEAKMGNGQKVFTGIMRDMSAEEQMGQKMEAMINSAVDPIVQIDDHGIIRMVNPACCRVFKYTEDQMVGNNVKMLMPDNHANRHDEYLTTYRQTGVKKVMGTGRNLKGRKSDGNTFHMFLSLSEAKVGDKIIFTGIIRDLSAETAERQKMEAMINSAVDPIVQIDSDGIIKMVNPACCRVFKYEEHQMLGLNIQLLMPKNHVNRYNEFFRNHNNSKKEGGLVGSGIQLRGRKSDGSTFAMFMSVSVAKIGDQEIFTGIIRDLTIQSSHRLYRPDLI